MLCEVYSCDDYTIETKICFRDIVLDYNWVYVRVLNNVEATCWVEYDNDGNWWRRYFYVVAKLANST